MWANVNKILSKKININKSSEKDAPIKQDISKLSSNNIILFSFVAVLLIILLLFIQTILINLSIDTPIKDTSIKNTNVIQEEVVDNNSDMDNDTVEKTNDEKELYFKTISNILYFKKNSNQAIYSSEISNINSNNTIDEDSSNVSNSKESQDLTKTQQPSVVNNIPTSADVTSLINYTEKLSIAALKIQSCGVDSKININNDKYEHLYTALKNKGIQMSEVSLYTLSEDKYSAYLDSNYNLGHFLVITNPSSLFGDVVYIGADGNGIKDDDGTLWFSKELYK